MKRRSEELASEKDILKVPPLPSALISYLPEACVYPHQFQPLWSGEIRDLTQALRFPGPVGSSLKPPSV